MQENCKYPGEMRGGGAAERKARWCHPWKLLTRLPLFCSSTFISLFIIYLFPPGSSTLVLSLIKEQRVAGLTCQIFQWPLYRQQRYQAAKNRGTKKKNQTSGFPWLGEVRRGCLHLSELQKNSHLSGKRTIKKKKEQFSLKGNCDGISTAGHS